MNEVIYDKAKTQTIPAWMTGRREMAPFPRPSGRRRVSFISKTLRQLRQAILRDLYTEQFAHRQAFLQAIDPRIKLVLAIGLILLVGITRSIGMLAVIWIFTLILMRISALEVLELEKRIWGFFPLLTLIISLPGLLNLFNPGYPLLVLYHFPHPTHWLGYDFPSTIYISRQGALAAAFMFLRTGLSISVAVLLVTTTPTAQLFKALRVLRVPRLFVMIMEMTYRYLVLLLNLSLEMFEARSIRTVGKLTLRNQQMQVVSSMGALFIKSMELSGEIYQAMTARCYTGDAVSFD